MSQTTLEQNPTNEEVVKTPAERLAELPGELTDAANALLALTHQEGDIGEYHNSNHTGLNGGSDIFVKKTVDDKGGIQYSVVLDGYQKGMIGSSYARKVAKWGDDRDLEIDWHLESYNPTSNFDGKDYEGDAKIKQDVRVAEAIKQAVEATTTYERTEKKREDAKVLAKITRKMLGY